ENTSPLAMSLELIIQKPVWKRDSRSGLPRIALVLPMASRPILFFFLSFLSSLSPLSFTLAILPHHRYGYLFRAHLGPVSGRPSPAPSLTPLGLSAPLP